jgi:glycerate 2-kinase
VLGIIKNRPRLATSDLRRQALDIIEAGIARVLPSVFLPAALSFDPSAGKLTVCGDAYELHGRLFVVGGGKASGFMAQVLENLVGAENITAGIVIDKAAPQEFKNDKIQIRQAGHPIPDLRGVAAVQEMLRLKEEYSIGQGDLVLALISGGGSALMPYPLAGISLADKQQVTRLLVSCGANIQEINTVRKHLSAIKGGRLAEYFAPARLISLILSDVIGNDLSVIASGLTYPDPSNYADALAVLARYNLTARVPSSVLAVLEKGRRGEIPETPKSLDNVHNYIVGDNQMALEAMAGKARSLGLNPAIISSTQTGDTAAAARQRAAEILRGDYAGFNALLIGGETTPTLPANPGKGGRNQHYAAVTLDLLKDYPGDWVFASVGTDGSDFMPEVAGAIVDKANLQTIDTQAAEFHNRIDRYDSNAILALAGNALVITGDTHTNVGDIMVYLLRNF